MDYSKIFLLKDVGEDEDRKKAIELKTDIALDWVKENTKWTEDDEVTPSILLFIDKFIDIIELPTGVSSDAIGGMPVTYDVEQEKLIDYWTGKLLAKYQKSKFTVTPAKNRWS